MGRKKDLTSEEKSVILALAAENKSVRHIASSVQRSKSAVHQFLVASKGGSKGGRSGAKPKITKTQNRAIVKAASKGIRAAREIRDTYSCDVTVRRVQQLLRNAPHLKHKKMLTGPSLIVKHKEERLKWAKDYSHWRTRWRRIVFSDEKKFNLDGPDGFAHYWHDLRKKPQYFSKRQQGGGSVTIWAAIAYNGASNIAVINCNLSSEKYCEVLTKCLLPFAAEVCLQDWIFQQDNASCHKSNHTKCFLADNYVDVLPWPARSPDLNIIENLWGILVRDVYKDCRQFGSKKELKDAIHKSWDEISIETIQKLFDSIPNCCMSVIERNGRKIKY